MEEFRKKLIEVINESHLPFEATYYIVKDVYRDVADNYENLLKEIQKNKQEQKVQNEQANEE